MNLISKKDLLALTGISYGQLYRWKREQLIPEEWFIKRASYTGQETFFPRDQIISRVQSIIELKDRYSLEELSKILSNDNGQTISRENIGQMTEINDELLSIVYQYYYKENYEIIEIAYLIAISQLYQSAKVTADNLEKLVISGLPMVSQQKYTDIECTFFLVKDEYHTVFSRISDSIAFDNSIQIINRVIVSEIADQIKYKYKNNIFEK